MLIYKNIASGKYFICIEDLKNENALFITPEGKIKELKKFLLVEISQKEEYILRKQGITYRDYINNEHLELRKKKLNLENQLKIQKEQKYSFVYFVVYCKKMQKYSYK